MLLCFLALVLCLEQSFAAHYISTVGAQAQPNMLMMCLLQSESSIWLLRRTPSNQPSGHDEWRVRSRLPSLRSVTCYGCAALPTPTADRMRLIPPQLIGRRWAAKALNNYVCCST